MDNLQEILTLVGLVIGTIVLVGGSLVLVRGSYSKARIQALREDNQDLRDRVSDCEAKCDASEAREAVLATEVHHLKSENELLTSLVTQRANVDEVVELLSRHHTAAMAGQQKLTEAINRLTEKSA